MTPSASAEPLAQDVAGVAGVRGSHAFAHIRSLALAVGVLVAVRTLLVDVVLVPSHSMQPTLRVGDVVVTLRIPRFARVASAWAGPLLKPFALKQDEIVIFNEPPHDGKPGVQAVKRVAGLGGDTVEMRRGTVFRNGAPVRLSVQVSTADFQLAEFHWLPKPPGRAVATGSNWGPLRVPRDSLFLLGDNRLRSLDSRYYGFVPATAATQRPLFILWSYGEPEQGGSRKVVRWGRLFRWPR